MQGLSTQCLAQERHPDAHGQHDGQHIQRREQIAHPARGDQLVDEIHQHCRADQKHQQPRRVPFTAQ